MLELKLQYFGHLMQRVGSLEKTLMLGGIGGRRRRGRQRMRWLGWHHWLNAHEFGWTLGVGDGQGGLACCDSWGRKGSDTTERLNWLNWTDGYLDCFPVLAIVNNAAVNIGMQIHFQVSDFIYLDTFPELLDYMVVPFLIFWETSKRFPIVATPIYIPTNSAQRLPEKKALYAELSWLERVACWHR